MSKSEEITKEIDPSLAIKIIDEWIDNLENNRYSQTFNTLRHGDCFCAIGVLCDVAQKNGLGDWTVNHEFGKDYFEFVGIGNFYSMVVKIMQASGKFGGHEVCAVVKNKIIALNDNFHVNFPNIAKDIKAMVKR